tara:strand:+ start:106 stop:4317 length:4212 start_codon:yes stop_codon:yes gene_type:complete
MILTKSISDGLNKIFSDHQNKIILSIIFIFGFSLRLIGINWDSGYLFHPDERAIMMHGYDISFLSLKSLDFFNSEISTLNPKWFNYGSFPVYFVKIVSIFSNFFSNTSIYDLRIPLRIFSALIDSITIIFLYKFSRIILDKNWSLLVSFLASISLINIQNSHFFTTDIFITNFSLLILYFSYKNIYALTIKKSIFLAILFALGMAFKFSFITLLIPISVSFFLYLKINQEKISNFFMNLIVFIFSFSIFIFIFQPYMFLDFSTYLSHVNEQSKMVRGILDFPYTRQYYETKSFIYPVLQIFKWGLGPFLSIICFLGSFYFLIISIKNKSLFGLLVFIWIIPYFLINGSFQVKFTRYFLPMIPILIFFGVSFIKFLADIYISKKIISRKIRYLILILFLIPSVHFTFSYINGIYLTEHPAYKASIWLGDNSSQNQIIIQEHWEESIPRLSGLNLAHERLEMYNPDTPEKFLKVFQQLSESDYYVLYSNRLYATIPRLEDRYPGSKLFYEKVFNGDFGFNIVNYQKQSMNLFGVNYSENYFERVDIEKPKIISDYEDKFNFNINLGWSDESFSVYDHPNVIILRNDKKYSQEKLFEIFGFDDFNNINYYDFSSNYPYKKVQSDESLVSSNSYKDQFFSSEYSLLLQILFWFITIQIFTFFSLPIFYKLFLNFPDFGFGFYKFFGLILFGFIIWLLSSNKLLDFIFIELLAVLLISLLISFFLFIKNKDEIFFYISKSKEKIFLIEFIFLITFVFFLIIRYLNPDLWHPYRGGEKPMDYAYLNAILRSTSFPPHDPWFSGFSMNYYYFGQYLVALVSKLSGIPSNISYNLAIPTFFAFSSASIFSFSSNFSYLYKKSKGLRIDWFKTPLISGIFGILFVLIFGNFDSIIQIINIIFGNQDNFDYWRSTRTVSMVSGGLEINEFPFFTFLFADLHAHLLSIPIIISIITVSFLFYYESSSKLIVIKKFSVLFFLSFLTGLIKATNSWDYPLAIMIVSTSILILNFTSNDKLTYKIVKSAIYLIFYMIISRLLFLNFDLNFIMPDLSLSLSTWKTPILSFLQILFLPITLFFIYLTFYFHNLRSRIQIIYPKLKLSIKQLVIVTFSTLLLIIIFVFLYDFLTILSLLLIIFSLVFLVFLKFKFYENDFRLFLWLSIMLTLGFGLPLFTEFLIIDTDINRMNTYFKFNFQSWILLNLSSSIIITFILNEIDSNYKKYIFISAFTLIFFIGISYPIYAIKPRLLDRFNNDYYELDGTKYMLNAEYSQEGYWLNLSDSYKAIDWINKNISNNKVILEYSTDLYSWSSRVSINTGLPSVLGWDWHQKQQRSLDQNQVTLRKKQIEEFYKTDSNQYIEDFLESYDVGLIIYGSLESNFFPEFPKRLEEKLGDKITKLYDKNNYKIYEYNAEAK